MTAALERLAVTPGGKSLLFAICGAALWPQYGVVALLIAGAGAVSWLRPERRAEAMSLAAAAIFLSQLLPQSLSAGLGFRPLIFAIAWIAGVLIFGRAGLWPLHGIVTAALAALAILNLKWRPIAIAFAIQQLSMALLWRTSYWMKWRAKSGPAQSNAAIFSKIYALIPSFGSGGVPIGKSPEYFERHEARSSAELAAAHVDALKLLLLALLYRAILAWLDHTVWNPTPDASLWSWVFDVQAYLPSMNQLFSNPAGFPIAARWIGLFADLIRSILILAVFGHTAVGICNLIGYRLPRNTRAPLLANSILDFWARYYFYFKELLLDFFFFPVYLKLKRFSPATRSVVATFAAAGLGNFYYHALLYMGPLMQGNVAGYVQWTGARAIYSILLATGLSFSMVRAIRNPKLARRRWAGAIIATLFFAFIHIWSTGTESIAIGERWRLLGDLFGMNW